MSSRPMANGHPGAHLVSVPQGANFGVTVSPPSHPPDPEMGTLTGFARRV
ncbi:MAG: hypothetical protein ACK46Q_17135 [Hyphomonas sp.]